MHQSKLIYHGEGWGLGGEEGGRPWPVGGEEANAASSGGGVGGQQVGGEKGPGA